MLGGLEKKGGIQNPNSQGTDRGVSSGRVFLLSWARVGEEGGAFVASARMGPRAGAQKPSSFILGNKTV